MTFRREPGCWFAGHEQDRGQEARPMVAIGRPPSRGGAAPC